MRFSEDSKIFIGTFHNGDILFAENCRQKMMNIYQQEIPYLTPSLIPPVTKPQLIAHMLNNLQVVYLDRGDVTNALVIKDLLSMVAI